MSDSSRSTADRMRPILQAMERSIDSARRKRTHANGHLLKPADGENCTSSASGQAEGVMRPAPRSQFSPQHGLASPTVQPPATAGAPGQALHHGSPGSENELIIGRGTSKPQVDRSHGQMPLIGTSSLGASASAPVRSVLPNLDQQPAASPQGATSSGRVKAKPKRPNPFLNEQPNYRSQAS